MAENDSGDVVSKVEAELEPLDMSPAGVAHLVQMVERGEHRECGTLRRPDGKPFPISRRAAWTEEGNKIFRALYMSGKTPAELAKIFKVGVNVVYEKVKYLGLAEERNRLEVAVAERVASILAKTDNQELEESAHTAFIERCTKFASTVMSKAEAMSKTAGTPKDLLACITTYSKAVDIYRRANNLDEADRGGRPQGNTFNVLMGSVQADPLARAKEAKTVTPA